MNPLSPREASFVADHQELIRDVVTRLKFKLPKHVESSDLQSYGFEGLVDAVRRYDPRKGATFRTWAKLRIRGSIIDRLREIDQIPRSAHRLNKSDGVEPRRHIPFSTLGRDENQRIESTFSDGRKPHDSGEDDVWNLLDRNLPKRLSWFARERFQKQRKLKEIGNDLGLTESRMSQLEKKLLETIRKGGFMSGELAQDAHPLWTCAKHGPVPKPLLLGEDPYCPNDECSEKLEYPRSEPVSESGSVPDTPRS